MATVNLVIVLGSAIATHAPDTRLGVPCLRRLRGNTNYALPAGLTSLTSQASMFWGGQNGGDDSDDRADEADIKIGPSSREVTGGGSIRSWRGSLALLVTYSSLLSLRSRTSSWIPLILSSIAS